MAEYTYNTVSERDMDVLFMGAISTDRGFLELFLEKINASGKSVSVESVELSKVENKLGESDITVIVNIDGKKIGLLIEDKIDACAMPEQHERYIKRGDVAQDRGDYENYYVFIVCPEKYYEINEEAKKYEHYVTYEKCRDYLSNSDNPMANIWRQQLDQAIEKAKKPAEITFNEYQNDFFRKYLAYQKEHHPHLKCVTKETSNGWWPHYSTGIKLVYIYHKLTEGHVELIFSNAANKMDIIQDVAEKIREYGINGVFAVTAGKSAALRIEVPIMETQKTNAFELTDKNKLEVCFSAISKLYEFANLIVKVNKLIEV